MKVYHANLSRVHFAKRHPKATRYGQSISYFIRRLQWIGASAIAVPINGAWQVRDNS